MSLLVRRTGEAMIEQGAAFGQKRGSCGGRFLATPGRCSAVQHGRQAEQGRELRIPMQHAMDHAAALAHDLAGNLQDLVHERFEFPPQPASAAASWDARCRGVTGNSSADHAFRVHARRVITM